MNGTIYRSLSRSSISKVIAISFRSPKVFQFFSFLFFLIPLIPLLPILSPMNFPIQSCHQNWNKSGVRDKNALIYLTNSLASHPNTLLNKETRKRRNFHIHLFFHSYQCNFTAPLTSTKKLQINCSTYTR